MGKSEKSYTIEDLRRLLQDFDVEWTKKDSKAGLIARIRRWVEMNPSITNKDRIKILAGKLDRQPLRYQELDADGELKTSSYPRQFDQIIKSAVHEA